MHIHIYTYLRRIKVEHKALIIVPLISLSAPVNGSSPNGSTNNAVVLRRQKNAQISEFKHDEGIFNFTYIHTIIATHASLIR